MTNATDDGIISRRSLIAVGIVAAGALHSRRLFGLSDRLQSPAPPPGDLVIRNARPLDAEAPLEALTSYQTSPEHFFVRSHFGPPMPLPLAWSLTVDGEVAHPVTLTLDQIRAMGGTPRVVTLECAGNGRGLFRLPMTSGVQWERGAVSTATWTGVPLRAILDRARPTDGAQHFWMGAMDRAPLPTAPVFLRSIPRATALDDAFVAYEMNGKPIPALHGGPLRLIVPGWFGMASTKWLTSIHARRVESDNNFMAKGYRYADQSPVTTIRVKSLITSVADGARVSGSQIVVKGQAWSGAGSGGIRGVELSSDGGRTWRAARLVGPEAPGAWRSWEADVPIVASGRQSLMSRATDRQGAVQPVHAIANPGGYGNNSIHEVRFDAVRS